MYCLNRKYNSKIRELTNSLISISQIILAQYTYLILIEPRLTVIAMHINYTLLLIYVHMYVQ